MVLTSLQKNWTIFSLLLLTACTGWIVWTSFAYPTTTNGFTPAPRQGFLAPDFELEAITGDSIRLSRQQGKAVLVNFWASWCPPCKAEMPAIQKIFEQYSDQGLVVLGVNATNQDTSSAAEAFAQNEGLNFPILLDDSGGAGKLYQVHALPSTFFIDRRGIIQQVVIGGPISEAQLRAEIEKILYQEGD
jgi:cytochrome c biogenesis protein CcmG, thiol:disulfide interchange protein DsbE